MEEIFITVKTVALNNNCPECYNNEKLELTFKQKFKETAFIKSITKEIRKELFCKNCDTQIYPALWNDTIDRVIDYQTKAFNPKPTSFKLKRLSWILLIGFALIVFITTLYSLGIFDDLLQS